MPTLDVAQLMKTEPIKFCWFDLGDNQVCERLAGHDGDCSPDPTVDFPIAVRLRAEHDEDYRRRLKAVVDAIEDTGFSGAGIRARLNELGDDPATFEDQ